MVTATTRPPRPGEVDGRDYRFLTAAEFDRLEGDGGLLESVRARGAAYGTPAGELERIWAAGSVPLAVLDADGAAAVRARCPGATVFFVDADIDERAARRAVAKRLRGRGERPSEVRRRMADNERAWARKGEWDVVVYNRDGCARHAAEALCRIAREARGARTLDGLERELGRGGRAPLPAPRRARGAR